MELQNDNHHPQDLLREAALIGPGYRGERQAATFSRRTALTEKFQEAGAEPPAYLAREGDWIERRAKLFEVGSYPDKGVDVTHEQLNRLATSFDLPVPVLIEHAESPFELGYLTQVEHVGNELFGTLSLTTEANSLVERSGSKSLSLGLAGDLSQIREVSLVRNPRVASAQLFSSEIRFDVQLEFAGQQGVNWQRKYDQLMRERKSEDADRQVRAFLAEGKLTPAQAPLAKALLSSDDAVNFDGVSQPLAQLMIAMIQRQPPSALFKEQAPAPQVDYSQQLMMPEEAEFYQKHFPGVSLDEIAKRR